MKKRIGKFVLHRLYRYGFLEGGRTIWLNESWSTNGWLFIPPWSSIARDTITLPPGY